MPTPTENVDNVQCEDCEVTTHIDNTRLVDGETRLICNDCDDNYIDCDDCDDRVNVDYAYRLGSEEEICEHCYDNGDYSTCCSCGEINHYTDTHYPENDDPICHRCHPTNRSRIHSYGHKPSPLFHDVKHGKNFTNGLGLKNSDFITDAEKKLKAFEKMYFGIELEIDAEERKERKTCVKDISKDESLFYCKEDSSLRNGFEIVSHPVSWDYFKSNKETFQNVLKISRKHGFVSHDIGTCGMHIHVNKSALTNLDIFKIVYFVFSNPDFIKIISQRNWSQIDRWASVKIDHFIQYASDPKEKVKILSEVAKCKSGGSRVAINLQNRNTVEFRIFRGTLNWSSYQKNVEFVHSLISWCKSVSLKHVQDKDSVFSFLDYLTKNQTDYPHLILFLFKKFFTMDVRKRELPPLYKQMKHFDFHSRLNLKQLTKKKESAYVHSHIKA